MTDPADDPLGPVDPGDQSEVRRSLAHTMSRAELTQAIRNPHWRMRNLYWITDKTGRKVLFVPNEHQERLYSDMWWRNLILKARQLGYSTAIQLLGFDTCLFTPGNNGAVIAQDRDTSAAIFRKIKYAYYNLPQFIRDAHPLLRETAEEIVIGHNRGDNSTFAVTTSARGGTLQFLHISEYGKICAKYPDKAQEVMTGSLPAAERGMIFIESTAEGQEGDFYEKAQTAEKLHLANKKLSRQEYRFIFTPWWAGAEYTADPAEVDVSSRDHDYLNRVESLIGRELTAGQRAWYVSTRDNAFSGDSQLMKQEYPSTPEEAFEQSLEGVYFAEQLAAANRQGRVTDLPYDPTVPVNTFWDLGKNDSTSIWFHQRIGMWDHFIDFFEASDEAFSFYVRHMQSLGYIWGRHYLPHDGEHRSWGVDQLKTAEDMLYDLGLRNIQIVPRTPNLGIAIRQVRDAFPRYRFDRTKCKEGLHHLAHYRKAWNPRLGAWSETPLPNGHQHAADAIRQHAQVFMEPVGTGPSSRGKRRRRVGGMAA